MRYTMSERTRETIPSLLEQIDSSEQWKTKKNEILSDWKQLLGTAPVFAAEDESRPMAYEVVGEAEEADHRRLDIRYRTLDGDTVAAFLLLPKRAIDDKSKRPAVLALHPTSADGRADVATPSGRPNRMYGVELAARGYVVLAPDSVTFGSRVYPGTEPFQTAPFYSLYPDWTIIGKMLADHKRAIDLLCSMEIVDTGRIGVIGHSLGGYNGWFLATMDERIQAVVSSCGFSMFTEDPDPNRWGRREWFSHAPVITEYLNQDRIPFEWHEIVALAAPTPILMWSGLADRIFPNWTAITAGMAEVDGLYRFLGTEDRFRFVMGNAGHDFPLSIRTMAYDFLDRWLQQ